MLAKMESRQCTPSVIARLMGLDELSSRQPVHKKPKVLSEIYLRRVASVGVRGKRSSHERQSFRSIAEEKKEFRDTFEVHGKLTREEHCNLLVEKGKLNLSLSAAKEVDGAQRVVESKIELFLKYLQEPDSLITDHLYNFQGIPYHLRSVFNSSNTSNTGMTNICNISGRETDQESDKLLRELGTGLVTDTWGEQVLGNGYKFLESRKESENRPNKIVVLKPKLRKKENAARYFPSCSSCRDFHSINKKHKEFTNPENGNLYVEEHETKNMSKDEEFDRLNFRTSAKMSGQTEQGKKLFMKVLKPGSKDDDTFAKASDLKTFISPNACDWKNNQQPSFYHSDGSSSGNLDFRLGGHGHSSQNDLCSNLFTRPLESANRLQHRFRKQSHNQKKGSEYRNSESCCMKSQSYPCPESTNSYSVRDDRVLQGELNRKLEDKDTCEQTNLVFKSSGHSVASASMIDGRVTDVETVVEGQSSENHTEQHSGETDCMLLVEDDYFSSQVPYAYTHQVAYAYTQQDISFGTFKEDSGSSFCSCTDPEFLVNSEEAYQPSPNSVLEPLFEKEISSSSGCFQGFDANLHGLQLQLELLKSESSDTYSEGDGMIVSSDDDFEQGSVSKTRKSEQYMRTFSIEDGRDFSYLLDVFTEAGFHGRNLGMSYDTISPVVFEMLEKKYGEQISWKRSERRLLFDQINSELKEILQPSIGSHWKKPLSTRLCFRKSLDMIEEELWTLLDHHKKQASKDSFGKVMGRDDGWLELGDDIEVIVTEIEDSLIDQLATEVVSMETF